MLLDAGIGGWIEKIAYNLVNLIRAIFVFEVLKNLIQRYRSVGIGEYALQELSRRCISRSSQLLDDLPRKLGEPGKTCRSAYAGATQEDHVSVVTRFQEFFRDARPVRQKSHLALPQLRAGRKYPCTSNGRGKIIAMVAASALHFSRIGYTSDL